MFSPNALTKLAILMSVVACGGCALPATAPTAGNVEAAPSAAEADYFIIPLAPPVVRIMGDRPANGFPAAFHLAGYKSSIALRPGDVIGVTIFETGGSSVFGFNAPAAAPAIAKATVGPVPVRLAALDADTPLPEEAMHAIVARASDAPVPFGTPPVPAMIDPTPVGSIPQQMAQATPTLPAAPPPPAAAPPSAIGPSKTTTLPALTVEANGTVLIPFVGPVTVAGLTPSAAAERIMDALGRQALKPQVLVSVLGNTSGLATVGGEANRPGPVTLTLRGEKLLDVVGQAGGSKWPAPDTDIDIIRGRTAAKVKLQTVVENPGENISIRPNDQVFLTHNPRSFTVLGASQKVSQYTFDVPKVSLAEAVGRAGGAIDTVGNPAAVYLFREEPIALASHVLEASAASTPQVASNAAPRPMLTGPYIKMVYRINMANAEGYFLSRKVMMRDKDVILIANAEGTQLLKALTIARGFTGIASDLNIFGIGGPLSGTTLN